MRLAFVSRVVAAVLATTVLGTAVAEARPPEPDDLVLIERDANDDGWKWGAGLTAIGAVAGGVALGAAALGAAPVIVTGAAVVGVGLAVVGIGKIGWSLFKKARAHFARKEVERVIAPTVPAPAGDGANPSRDTDTRPPGTNPSRIPRGGTAGTPSGGGAPR